MIKRVVWLSVVLAALCFQNLSTYAAESPQTLAGAQKEGKLVIYSSTDSASVEPLLQDFKSLYPFLQVEYNDLNTTESQTTRSIILIPPHFQSLKVAG